MKIQVPAAILILTAILVSSVSCGETEPAVINETEAQTTAESESVVQYADNLPGDLDFGGKAVNFLYREEVSDEFYADTDNADIVNDAINASIRSVEERLNTDIVLITKAGHLNEARVGYRNDIVNSVLAGDSVYDWVDLMIGITPMVAQQGVFMDLSTAEYLDYHQPWYINRLETTAAFDGKLFMVAGDASLGYLKSAYCMYFNKQTADNYDIANIYETVNSGKWTLDKLREYAAMTSQDLNNDGQYTLDDQLGFILHDTNHRKGFVRSCGIELFKQDSEGKWQYTFGSERDETVIRRLRDLYASAGVYFYSGTNANASNLDEYYQIGTKFTSGSAFIISAELGDVIEQFRDMKDEYGILPFPKLDEEQVEYYTISRNTHNAFSMPITCADPAVCCAVLEALGSSNHEKVYPTYYETALKAKYSSSTDDGAMYDLIRNSMILDFGYVFENVISGTYLTVINMIDQNKGTFASELAKVQPAVVKSMETYRNEINSHCN